MARCPHSAQHVRRARAAGAVALVFASLAAAQVANLPPAAAATAPRDGAVVPADAAAFVPGLDARLAGAPLVPGAWSDAVAALGRAEERVAALLAEAAQGKVRASQLEAELARLAIREQRAAAELAEAEARTRRLAVAVYKHRGSQLTVEALLPAEDPVDLGRRQVFASTWSGNLADWARRSRLARDEARDGIERAGSELASVHGRLEAIDREFPVAVSEAGDSRDRVARTLPAATVAGLDIPLVTLNAYLRADARIAAEQPDCSAPWWLLAGVGRVESNHGRFGGARPASDGTISPPITGIALDGVGTAVIADTDGGGLDGDPLWDRAVGPMQFIPGTWNAWQTDGGGDGAADPQNVYDASLAAARYLCRGAGGGWLGDDGAIRSALWSYNQSAEYGERVLSLARSYQTQGLA